ncbi:hypothetical protein Xen7305DRAFT_00012570 [Xenococcus sp. PCC 7305]|uniref:hypothetical protein n=1 Tax=Xenococcus sp. PCC 7305 TaxID=102125 RepID=UPI0002AC6CCF|nr:hypothetical protein [Xenococcus sp. PCC 7305]ELS01553.1 hypothetical protein Xen7305DRAFT_00012570 [Xenococcus sp. PCC 7305]
MSNTRSIQLKVNVEPQLKNDFQALCDRENVSLSSAIEDLMGKCIDKDTLAISSSSRLHFHDREIETLKNLASNYSDLLNNFYLLQKRVSRLEQLFQES